MVDPFDAVLDVLADERFKRIRRTADERLLVWDDFITMEMPDNTTPEAVWRVLTLLRRQTAEVSPVYLDQTSDPSQVWYTVPRQSEALIREIIAHSGATSFLSQSIHRHPYNTLDLQDQVEEVLACAAWDGAAIDYESAREIITGGRGPERSVEHVIANYCAIIEESVVSRAPTDETVEALYRRLVAGAVDDVHFDRTVANAFDVQMREAEFALSAPMLVVSSHFPEILWHHRSFRQWDGMFGSLMRKIYFIRAGHPVFSLLPMSKLMLDWWDHKIDNSLLPSTPEQNWRTSPYQSTHAGEPVDATSYIVTYIYFMHHALELVAQRVRELESRENHLRALVRSAHTLNYRQRDVLLVALEGQDREFRIADHQAVYQSAYATARADLLGLVNLGFMHMKQHGKKSFVFRTQPDFKQTIEQRLSPRP